MSTLDTAEAPVTRARAGRGSRRPGAGGGFTSCSFSACVVTVVPFLWMLLGSLKTQRELVAVPPTWLPENPTMDNYERLFSRLDFPRFFWNSTVIAVMITVANLLFCSMVGYALAKLRFAGRELILVLVLATLLVPGSVMLAPLFVLMSR